MHLLIISHDTIGAHMAGPGIRYWELARALASELSVTLIAPTTITLEASHVTTGTYQWGDGASLAPWLSQADALLANAYLLEAHPELANVPVRRIIDLYDPTMLENIELLRDAPQAEGDQRLRHDLALFRRQLAAGDHFLCATERQRDLYLGALLATGRVDAARVATDPLLRGLIDVLPFGLPAEPAVRSGLPGPRQRIPAIGPTAPLILWNGGLWDWMDPITLIEAMPAVVAQVPTARLLFLAGPHPGSARPQMPARARARALELGLLDQAIFFYEQWVPYAQRVDFLFDATVVVSLHRQHLETAYAALRSRILDQLWVGLPGLISDGDQAAHLARVHGFAVVVPPEDRSAVAHALINMLTDELQRERMADAARLLAAQFRWPILAQQVIRLLQLPAPARNDEEQHRTMTSVTRSEPHQNDVSQIERGQLLHAVRNSALQALEKHWQLRAPPVPATGRLTALRHTIQSRLLWPLIAPLMVHQQTQNAAVVRAFYALAEQNDYIGTMGSQLMVAVNDLHATARQLRDDLARVDQRLTASVDELDHRVLCERHLVAQQIERFAEQLIALEEAAQQLRALARAEVAPPPSSVYSPEA